MYSLWSVYFLSDTLKNRIKEDLLYDKKYDETELNKNIKNKT